MKASHQPFEAMVGSQIVPLERGQFVYGLKEASGELNLPKSTVEYYLNRLKDMGKVGIKHTNKYSVLTVENWDFYQGSSDEDLKKVGNKLEANWNIQEYKEKNNKKPYGEFQNVWLTDDELEKLKKKFPQDYKDRIESLSAYKKSKGKKYKSDYATILNWARMEKKKEEKKEGEKLVW